MDRKTTSQDAEPPSGGQEALELKEHRSLTRRIVEGILEDKKALAGATILLILLITALGAPYLAPHGAEDNFERFKEPNSWSTGDFDRDGETERAWHPMGTDSFGFDIFSRLIYGARISMTIALATVAFAFTLGTTIGLMAGYFGGWVDNVLMRYIDFQWAFPELILAIGIIAYIGGLGVYNVILAIGLAYVDDFARIVRGEVLSIREEEYITAARAIGMGDVRIMTREILPNAVAPLIVQATLMVPLAILAEAGLSFLGLGVKVTTPTWGILLSQGQNYIGTAWWISIMPGLAIMAAVLSFNLLGDGLRDIFDISQMEVEQ